MGFFTTRCPKCGEKVRRLSSFCPHCGEGAETLWRTCPECRGIVSGAAKFCGNCGQPIRVEGAPADTVSQAWRRGPNDFAVRFELEDLKGAFKGGLIVQHGTQALLLIDGKLVQTLGPGRYTPESDAVQGIQWTRDPQHGTVILVDAGHDEIDYAFDGVRTKDNLTLTVKCAVALRVADPARFYVDVIKDAAGFLKADLHKLTEAEFGNGIAEVTRLYSALELVSTAEVKAAYEAGLQEHMRRSMSRIGLDLAQIRTIQFDSEEIQKLLDRRGAIALGEHNVDVIQDRIRVREELLKALQQKKISDLVREGEWQKFVKDFKLDQDKQELLRDEELDELRRILEHEKEMDELAKQHASDKLRAENDLDLQRTKMLGQADLSIEIATKQIERERLRIEKERLTWLDELRRTEEKVRIGMEARKTKDELDLARRRGGQDLDLERLRAEEEVARQRLQEMRQMTPDQILAVMSENPNAAGVLIERAKAEATQNTEMQGLYDQMLQVAQKGQTDLKEVALAITGRPPVAYPPPGSGLLASVGGGQAEQKVQVCPKCTRDIPAGSRFCDNCGHKFFE